MKHKTRLKLVIKLFHFFLIITISIHFVLTLFKPTFLLQNNKKIHIVVEKLQNKIRHNNEKYIFHPKLLRNIVD